MYIVLEEARAPHHVVVPLRNSIKQFSQDARVVELPVDPSHQIWVKARKACWFPQVEVGTYEGVNLQEEFGPIQHKPGLTKNECFPKLQGHKFTIAALLLLAALLLPSRLQHYDQQ